MFDIGKFNGVTNFNLWQLCLANRVLQELLVEKTSFALWKRLETLYATKSLANRLVLK
ncbi:hypothetical protein Gohar_019560 [Gossypium harknessii]|uniref:Uncharacterized protein n=1 Tax=Gossypium harknessii TaxID=34285 RepID=A0A7J9IE73_9ROSI|nr:hypothetical protein [Gossypium harknessii]